MSLIIDHTGVDGRVSEKKSTHEKKAIKQFNDCECVSVTCGYEKYEAKEKHIGKLSMWVWDIQWYNEPMFTK